jgi:drug/metabolite transporter (DMT)-like permease
VRTGQIAAAVLVALSLSIGQILLKIAADQIAVAKDAPLWLRAVSNPFLIGACLLYATTTGAWVWILSGAQLSRAYPFVVLSFVLTPLLAFVLLHERLTPGYLVGMALIVAGLYFVQQH